MAHIQKNMKDLLLAVLLIKLFVLIIDLAKKLFFTEEKIAFYRFIEAILNEYDYCKKIIKRNFNKNLIMSAEEETFQLSSGCLICNKLFDVGDDKVRDHCHVTGKPNEVQHIGVVVLILN